MHQGQPCFQSAGCPRRDQRHRTGRLYRPGPRAGQSLLRNLAGQRYGRLYAEERLMPDLLLELFCEEIPARMQAGAARDLERLVVGALTDRGLLFEGIKAFAGPRRLTLAVAGLPAKQRDVREELKGPKVDAPPAAIEGFLKKTGLTREQLKVETTPKGDVYLAVIERAGRDTA